MKTLAIIADGHTNSIVGLSKPEIKLDDGSVVSSSIPRRWLFWTYNEILLEIDKRKKGDLYGVLNGDAIELDAKQRNKTELITQNQERAVEMGVEIYEPFFQMCQGVYVLRGTQAHTGEQAQAEEALAHNFDNTIRNEETGRASWWHLPLLFDGVLMDICHHPKGGGSGRPMNSQTGVDRIASDALFSYANNGEVPPRLLIRSHLHAYRDSYNAFRTRAIITPAMSLLTSFTYRLGINFSEDIGVILVHCHNGEYELEVLKYPVRKQQWQII